MSANRQFPLQIQCTAYPITFIQSLANFTNVNTLANGSTNKASSNSLISETNIN